MKILLINGSPKPGKSSSELVLNFLQEQIGTHNEYIALKASQAGTPQAIAEAAEGCHAIVVAFPLYVDALPSHLLQFLENAKHCFPAGTALYAVANSGFYEGRQNSLALEILKNYCDSTGLHYHGGLGIGAGEMLSVAPIGKGPLTKIGLSLTTLATGIAQQAAVDISFAEPNFPRFLYILAAHSQWRKSAKSNGLRTKDIYRKYSHL